MCCHPGCTHSPRRSSPIRASLSSSATYNARMGVFVDLAYATAAIAASPWLALRAWRADRGGDPRPGDSAARFGHCCITPPDGRPTLLIHGVSVGETNAITGLIERVEARSREADPSSRGWRIIVAASTDTGLARARQLHEPEIPIVRFPLDFSFCMRRFLDAVQPDLVALTELEVWPNFTELCARRGIPVGVVNGRLSERSFRGYRRFAPIVRPMFRRLSFVGAQTRAIAARFEAVGVGPDRIEVTDSLKWDTTAIADGVAGTEALAEAMGIDRSRPLIVAGSTGPGEERLLIDTCPANAQLLLAPRRPERFDEVAALEPGIIRRSQQPDGTRRAAGGGRLFLLDTMGELQKAYALADVAIVGRSFLGLYGSNVTEPIALGKPTLIGPHHSDFADTVAAFAEAGGLIITEQPGIEAARLLNEPATAAELSRMGRDVILSRQGATDRTVRLLLRHMPRRTPAEPVPGESATSRPPAHTVAAGEPAVETAPSHATTTAPAHTADRPDPCHRPICETSPSSPPGASSSSSARRC